VQQPAMRALLALMLALQLHGALSWDNGLALTRK
jgi:hypothetical protein